MRRMTSTLTFDNYVNNYLIAFKKDFELEKTNGIQRVVWNKEKGFGAIHRKKLSEEDMKKLWVFGAVKKSMKKYYAANPKFEIFPSFPSFKKDPENISKLKQGQIFLSTDADHCFWRVGYLLEYINEKLYEKMLPKEYKLLRNKAMACCTSLKIIEIYKKGVLSETIKQGDAQLKQLYANVRNFSFEVMDKCSRAAGKSFLKYRTDGICYLPNKREQIESILDSYNMPFKTVECTYIGGRKYLEGRDVKPI